MGEVEIHVGQILLSTQLAGMEATLKTTPSVNENSGGGDSKWVKNGGSDDYPLQLRTDAENDTVILPGLRLNAKLLYGGGLVYGRFKKNDKGELDWQYEYDLAIERWLRNTQMARQLFTLFYDIAFGAIAYPLFTKSVGGNSIAMMRLEHSRYMHCRLDKVDANGNHKYCFVSPDMGTSYFDEKKMQKYLVAPQYGTAEWVKKLAPGTSYVLPIKLVDTGRQNYPKPDWDSARSSNWVSISKSIAALNKGAIDNSMRPMWHIEIHQEFWPNYYGEEVWSKLFPPEKREKIKQYCDIIAKHLMGAENTGKYISSAILAPANQPEKLYHMLKITALENKVQLGSDGWYLTTSREASQHKVAAMSLTPSLMGIMPGDGGMGAGSGSNNRVELNQRVLMGVSEQDMFTNFMYHVAEVNGWPLDLVWTIKQGLITTLDSGAESSATSPMENTNSNG